VDASVVKAAASRQRFRNNDDDRGSGPGVREYLDGLQEDDAVAPPKRVSATDPQARWTAAPGGPAFYAYSTNYLVDTEAGIILDAEATPAHRTLEVQSTKTMIERLEERLTLKTGKLIGDTAYGTAEMLFAYMKRVLKMDRLRLLGLKGAQDEFLLTPTAQNVRRMAKYLGTGLPEILEMP